MKNLFKLIPDSVLGQETFKTQARLPFQEVHIQYALPPDAFGGRPLSDSVLGNCESTISCLQIGKHMQTRKVLFTVMQIEPGSAQRVAHCSAALNSQQTPN